MAIKISSDGGYTDIVIKIKDQVPEDKCPQILQNLKVRKKIDWGWALIRAWALI